MADTTYYKTKVEKKTSVEAPTGLKIERSGSKFIFSWTKGEDYDYAQSLHFQYKTGFASTGASGGYGPKFEIYIGRDTTSKSYTFSESAFHPHTNTILTGIKFLVAGQDYTSAGKPHYFKTSDTKIHDSKDYYEKSGNDYKQLSATDKNKIKKKKPADEKKDVQQLYELRGWAKNKTWSATKEKSLDIYPPAKPSIAVDWQGDEGFENQTKFTITEPADTVGRPFTIMQIYTALSSNPDPTKVSNWSKVYDGNKKSYVYAPKESNLGNFSITRHVKAVARGMGGKSEVAFAKYTYAPPQVVSNFTVTGQRNANATITVLPKFNVKMSNLYPVDVVEVQYQIAASTPVTDNNWQVGASWSPTKSSQSLTFVLDSWLPQNRFLYVRTVAKYGSFNTPTAAKQVSGIGEALATPVFSSDPESGEDKTYTFKIPVTSNTDIPGAKMAIYYYDNGSGYNNKVIWAGEATNGTITVQLPKYTLLTPIRFGVMVFLGSYSVASTVPVVDDRTATFYNINASIKSQVTTTDTIFNNPDSTIVPIAPEISGGSYNPDDHAYTINWNHKFAEAQGSEVSWSDESDALNSTKQPNKYEIGTPLQTSLILKDLADRKDYYVWVRSFVTINNQKIYSAYSSVKPFNTYRTPDVPIVTLSKSTVEWGSIVSLSWTYNNPDGGSQQSAIIEEVDPVLLDKNKRPLKIQTIGSVAEEHYYDFNLKDLTQKWDYGTSHNLRVTVSGERYSNSSDIVKVFVAPQLKSEIVDTSLDHDFHALNHDGRWITVDSDDGDEYITKMIVEAPFNPDGYDSINVHHKYSLSDGEEANTDYNYNNFGYAEYPEIDKFYGGTIDYLTGKIQYMYNKNGKTPSINGIKMPYVFSNGAAVVYNNKIHILGGSESNASLHYSFDGSAWEQEKNLPYSFRSGSAVVYNNKIHILGGSAGSLKHYSYDGSEWTEESTLPYSFMNGSAVVYNNKIHILGGYNNRYLHYSYNGSTWVEESTLTGEFLNGSAVVYNNKIHILGGNYANYHYSYDGSTWTKESTLPYSFDGGSAVVYNNKIHILGGVNNPTKHYYYDENSWHVSVDLANDLYYGSAVIFNNTIYILENSISYTKESTLPYYINGGSAVVYDNKIHILGGTNGAQKHYSYDGSTWAEESELPHRLEDGSAVVYDNKIHILGGAAYPSRHYSYDGSTWTQEENLPYSFSDGSAVVYNNKIHILGGLGSSTNTKHYSYDGSTWTEESTLPQKLSTFGAAVVYNDKIHILGLEGYLNYFYDDSTWVQEQNLPSTFYDISAVVYDNKIHVSGSNHAHLSFNGVWSSEPDSFYATPDEMLVYNNTLNILAGKDHLVFVDKPLKRSVRFLQNATWVEESTLAYEFSHGAAVVYNNKIHILGGMDNETGHYSYNGSTWAEELTLPYSFSEGSAVVYNNKIHILGGMTNVTKHYSYDGSTWAEESTLPYSFSSGSAVVYNDKIHILGGASGLQKHYSYDGSTWAEESTLPYSFSSGSAVVYNDKIHILGGARSAQGHFSYDGSTWAEESGLPYNFSFGSAVVYNDKIHILESGSYSGTSIHSSFDGSIWTEESRLADRFRWSSAVVYNDKIHVLGGVYSKIKHFHLDNAFFFEIDPTLNPVFYIGEYNPVIYAGVNEFSTDKNQVIHMTANYAINSLTLPGSIIGNTEPLVVGAGLLRRMPMWVEIEDRSSGQSRIENELYTIKLSIIRADDYAMIRPDEIESINYLGEIVYTRVFYGYGRKTIELEDLNDILDDWTDYLIVASVSDSVGQVYDTYYGFRVLWEQQAVIPEAEIGIDDDYNVAMIHILKPEGAVDTDTVDIYRLSSDKPKLIYKGAKYDEVYVDPYPTIGERGGYRVVTMTANGDYITPDTIPAWTDYSIYIDTKFQLINFDGNEVPLKYNVSLNHNWNKDFTETKYLGGAIQGDWHVGVHLTSSVDGNMFDDLDPDLYEMFRDLGDYSGPCNIRTIDGSNFTANINVSDSSTFNSLAHQHDLSLEITRVDPPYMDAMALDEWERTSE